VQDLHRDATSISMGRSEDRGHPAESEQHIEAPFLAEHSADA